LADEEVAAPLLFQAMSESGTLGGSAAIFFEPQNQIPYVS
jgi:hypothetical protein